jgi:hypothetical protein
LTFPRLRTLGVGVALVALSLGACTHSSSTTPAVGATATPTPNPSTTPAGCTAVSFGVAYIPDGGSGTFRGVQAVHFEDTSTNLCGTTQIVNIPFVGAVGALGFASDGTSGLAAVSTNGGSTYTTIQDIFGINTSALIPVGSTYNVTVTPTPAPSTTPTASGAVVLSDVNSVSILGTSTVSVGMVGGIGPGVLALTSLANAPPTFGGFVPYQGGTPDPGAGNRPIVSVGGTSEALVRGQSDVLLYEIDVVASGYQFTLTSIDTGLGYGAHNLRGSGMIAFDPADTTRAIIAGAPGPNDVTLVSGMPTTLARVTTITLPSRPHSVAIATGGLVAVVGADNGFYVLTGIDSGSLTLVTPFAANPLDSTANAPTFTGCTGATFRLTNVSTVGFSGDQRFLVAIGTPPTQVCPSGNNSTLMAFVFNTANGIPPTPSPSPTPTAGATAAPLTYTANNITTRPTDTDYVIVR